jgi:hypothetical protein
MIIYVKINSYLLFENNYTIILINISNSLFFYLCKSSDNFIIYLIILRNLIKEKIEEN